MNRSTKAILITGIILLVYGYLCRIVNLYFFWDAKTIGGILLFVGLLLYWLDLRKKRGQQGKKTTWITIGICVVAFGLALFTLITVIFNTTEAYHTAKAYIKSNLRIKEQIGNVESFGLIPGGSVQTTTMNGVESGNAVFEMTVNGTKKNMDMIIELKKEPDTSWTVIAFK